VDIFSRRTNTNAVKGRGLGHVTCYKISHSDIGLSPKRVSATDMNLAYGCILIISPKRKNKSPEKGRGIGLVTLIICSINKKALAQRSRTTAVRI